MDRIEALRLFLRLGERQSFTAAAKDLRIKQSTASKWVAELERELGATLILRTTRAVQLTEAGRQLQVRAREVVGAFDTLSGDFKSDDGLVQGSLRVSLPVVFGKLHVVPLILDFAQESPRVRIEMSLNDRYVNLVEEGYDLAVRVGVPVDSSDTIYKISGGRRRLVVSPAYLSSGPALRHPLDLREHRCLLFDHQNVSKIWRFSKEGSKPVVPNVTSRLLCNNSEVILDMARRAMGIALLADWLVADDLRRGTLRELFPDYSTPPAPLYALTPPGKTITRSLRLLINHLQQALAAKFG